MRAPLARRTGRPVTFGWGPRFLHSTGQYHKGGPPIGVYLQITGGTPHATSRCPDRPFTFGRLIAAQAAGDAAGARRPRPPGAAAAPERPGTAGAGACSALAAYGSRSGPEHRDSLGPGHNPLRDPRDKRLPRIAGPCGLVIFGVTGDLARKKLMPAIYDLANRGLLPPGFALVGFARRDWADAGLRKVVHDAVRQHARTPFREEVWRQLAEGFRFVPGDFDDDDAFDQLAADASHDLDADRGTGGNHAFYLSIPPKFFPVVLEQLDAPGCRDPQTATSGGGSSSRSRSGTT